MSEDEEKVCRNCKHRKRTVLNAIYCKDNCGIDGHFINYASYFTGTCDYWEKGKEDGTKTD
jgi:hypothetical protein